MTREQELQMFRNINGVSKKWNIEGSRRSFIDSNHPRHLRENQGKAKSKLIKHIIKNELPHEFWLGRGRDLC